MSSKITEQMCEYIITTAFGIASQPQIVAITAAEKSIIATLGINLLKSYREPICEMIEEGRSKTNGKRTYIPQDVARDTVTACLESLAFEFNNRATQCRKNGKIHGLNKKVLMLMHEFLYAAAALTRNSVFHSKGASPTLFIRDQICVTASLKAEQVIQAGQAKSKVKSQRRHQRPAPIHRDVSNINASNAGNNIIHLRR